MGDSKEKRMNKRKENQAKIRKLTFLALLSAVVLLMATTPVGYFRLGPVSITFLAIPVVVGGIIIGPIGGGILGLIFGITSFAQCFGIDPLGTALLGYNPFLTAVMCIVPRILIGVFSGLSYKIFSKLFNHKNSMLKTLKYVFSSLIGSITNSIFFIGFMLLFFWKTPDIQAFGSDLLTVLGVMFTANVFIEAAVCLIISASLSKVFHILENRFSAQ